MDPDLNPYIDRTIAGSSAGGTSAANSSTASVSRSQTPVTPGSEQPSTVLPASLAQTVRFRPLGDRQQSSIRIRRGSTNQLPPLETIPSGGAVEDQTQVGDNGLLRPSSNLRAGGGSRSRAGSNAVPLGRLPTIQDDVAQLDFGTTATAQRTNDGNSHGQAASRPGTSDGKLSRPEYDSNIVDFLDVIDPEVATLSSITNVQNSLFVPSLGRFVNRRPTYDLSFVGRIPGAFPDVSDDEAGDSAEPVNRRSTLNRTYSITSQITPSHYAVLPSGRSLDGWTQEEVDQLNDHVRHMMHSRRSKLKRTFRAFGKYVRRPLGFAVTLYATLITLFGLAWVLFLIGWISVGDKQLYVINVIDNVLVALFAIVGDGLAPFRLVDTYHMIYIVHYHRVTWKRRKALALPKLENKNDLPTDTVDPSQAKDVEAYRQEDPSATGHEVSVLTPKQQAKLTHHQDKMFKSHTFYKPHETETHHAFPLSLLVVIIVLLDLHSCLQISLGSVTWSTDYHVRSAAVTTTILCLSITANTTAGIVIAIGDRKTRKKEVIERMVRQELTDQAMRKVQKEKAAREVEELAARKDASRVGRFDVSTDTLRRVSEELPRRSNRASEEGLVRDKETAVEGGSSPSIPGGFPSPS